jgi:hypothetical protein
MRLCYGMIYDDSREISGTRLTSWLICGRMLSPTQLTINQNLIKSPTQNKLESVLDTHIHLDSVVGLSVLV